MSTPIDFTNFLTIIVFAASRAQSYKVCSN